MNIDDAAMRAALHNAAEAVAPPADGPARILRLASQDPNAEGATITGSGPRDTRRWQRSTIAIGLAAAIIGGIAFVPRVLDEGSEPGDNAATARGNASEATGAPSPDAADDAGRASVGGQNLRDSDGTVPAAASPTAAPSSAPDASTEGAGELADRTATRYVTLSATVVEVREGDAHALQQRLRSEPQAKVTEFGAADRSEWIVRVPAERLDATLELLRADGAVVRTTVTRTNVSALYAQLVTQRFSYLTAATALERAAEAETSATAAKVARSESSRIRARLAQVERRLAVLLDQIRYATITVRTSPTTSSSAPRRRRSPRAASPRSHRAAPS